MYIYKYVYRYLWVNIKECGEVSLPSVGIEVLRVDIRHIDHVTDVYFIFKEKVHEI
jgi:hypothetical protein